MKSVVIFLTFVAILLLARACSGPRPPQATEKNDYIIVMEAESLPPSEGWSLQKELPGFTGKGYLAWTAEDTRETDQGVIVYPFELCKGGTYQLAFRSHQGGAIWDASNDMFVHIPTAKKVDDYPDMAKPEKVYVGSESDFELDREGRIAARESLTNEWRWWSWGEEPRAVIRVDLEKGKHELRISGRSKGFAFDRIAIFRLGEATYEQQPDKAFLEKLTSAKSSDG